MGFLLKVGWVDRWVMEGCVGKWLGEQVYG